MHLRILFGILLVSATPSIFGQKSVKEICQETLVNLQKTESGVWNKLNDSTIYWTYKDTFRIVNKTSPIRGAAQPDSMTISLKFAGDWNAEKIEQTKLENTAKIDPLSAKFLAALDSIKWEGVKLNRQLFFENKVLYLPLLQDIVHFSEEEMKSLKSIVRIPDYVYEGTGIYVDSRPNYEFQYVAEIAIDNILFDQLKFVAKTLDSEKTKIGIKVYE